MPDYSQHPAYEIINQSQTLMEVALFAEQLHTNVPYHNFGHILNAVVYANAEIQRYHQNEPTLLPVTGIFKALLLHDSLVHLPADDQFISKEHRSAAIAGYGLRELGSPEEEIANVKKWIINTNPDYPCDDDAGRVVCRADLGNTADDLAVFVREFINVYLENKLAKLKAGRPQDIVNPLLAAKESIDYIKLYFRQDLTLGTGDWDKRNGVSSFVMRALANFTDLPKAIEALPAETFDLSDTDV